MGVKKTPTSAAILLVLLLAIFSSGCGSFFVSGNAVNSINVTPTSVFLAVGETKQLTANGTTVNGDSNDITSTAKWTSSSVGVASVSAGLVTAVTSGNATITVSQDGVSATSGIIVNASPITDIVITGSTTTLASGSGTVQLTGTAKFQDGTTKDETNQVTWSSDSTNVAKVSSTGLVTAQSTTGTANISASVTTTTGTVTSQSKYQITVQ
jgi:Bacterial Ig-like domain (group 2)